MSPKFNPVKLYFRLSVTQQRQKELEGEDEQTNPHSFPHYSLGNFSHPHKPYKSASEQQ